MSKITDQSLPPCPHLDGIDIPHAQSYHFPKSGNPPLGRGGRQLLVPRLGHAVHGQNKENHPDVLGWFFSTIAYRKSYAALRENAPQMSSAVSTNSLRDNSFGAVTTTDTL